MIPVSTVTLLLGVLALVANVAVIGLVLLALGSRVSGGAADLLARTRARLSGRAVALAWVVALIATAGSLYFSEIANFQPCRLCWFQRIMMYPLVIILLVGALRRERAVRWYAAPLALIGAGISAYHYLVEWYPQLESGSCGLGPPCTLVWFREFGFVSIPYLALSAFLLILGLLWLARPAASTPKGES